GGRIGPLQLDLAEHQLHRADHQCVAVGVDVGLRRRDDPEGGPGGTRTNWRRARRQVEADYSGGGCPTVAAAAEDGSEHEGGARDVNGVPGHDRLPEWVDADVLTPNTRASRKPGGVYAFKTMMYK